MTAALVVVAAGWAIPPRGRPHRERALGAGTRAAIASTVTGELGAANVPGMAVGVFVGGSRYVGAFGRADVQTNAPFRPGDHVRIGGITESFVATEVLHLVDEHRLGLNAPLSRYVPDIPNGDQITIRQLLNHTSGVYDYRQDPATAAAFEGVPTMDFGPSTALDVIAAHPPAFAPGRGWADSASDYLLLGQVIEAVTHHSVGAALTNDIIDRAHLAATSYPLGDAIPVPFSRGYLPSAHGAAPREVTSVNPAYVDASGAMISTLADLRTWVRSLASGAFLNAASHHAQMTTVATGITAPVEIRAGLGVLEAGGFVGQTGAIYGFNTAAFTLPSLNATIVVVSNSSDNTTRTALDTFLKLAALLDPGRFGSAAPSSR
ncbi:MAG TPA: serine hydrolase domain-containing protein [Acidimicrobiia bacterium]|nr:serine hydrolase domain-containing protein [Acidimicrobiia bacterium]